jgi:hypothetical protein
VGDRDDRAAEHGGRWIGNTATRLRRLRPEVATGSSDQHGRESKASWQPRLELCDFGFENAFETV